MVKYTMMKRITKIFGSILFIVTILTVYLTFDFAINTALSNKYSTDKYEHIHNNNIKYKKTSTLSLLKINQTNPILKNNNDKQSNHITNQERHIRSVKDKQQQQHIIKSAKFHKSKTGIKINQIKKSHKQQRKNLLTTKFIQHKDFKSKNDKTHL
ncbi:unnamed protein product [Rotaria sp. Silwood1]|nr:unnamed protein product [Rotaria sp. Silwood1]CAF1580894.1 unnamed protein product [Rotaria sp. Silwood1]CAF3689098.1 unnamed protein product [Rotaria sp. Silwood1]CAF3987874.1 unnamed protein product [Rotaria sp. Silwood1]CAF4896599.1 unnamed protein product [Rotaria sp. Silwood1]